MKKIWIGLFAVYLLLLLYFVVFSFQYSSLHGYLKQGRELGYWYMNLRPFMTIIPYIKAFPAGHAMQNVFGNIIVFVPFGFLLAVIFPAMRKLWKNLLVSFITVLIIELVQIFSMYGFFDVDDIILNCIGGILGYGFYVLCRRIYPLRSLLKD